jgi:hypothetical protein
MNKYILTIITVLSFSFHSFATAKQFVSVHEIKGIAEIQRAGTIEWKYLTRDTKVNNNDIIRVNDSGKVTLKWPDGTMTYVQKNTQIMVTLYENKAKTTLRANATLMFGAAFFIVKKIIPHDDSEEMKVYTPTSVIAIRGTSFLVEVDTAKMTTAVKVLSGVVLVKNISKNLSAILGHPYKTIIEKNTNPSAPVAILKNDIDSLLQWIPEPVVNSQLTEQINQSKQDRSALLGTVEEKCIITQFVNNSDYKGSWKPGPEISRHFATLLGDYATRLVVMISDSVITNPVDFAKSQNARYVISGTIDHLETNPYAQISASADEYKESIIAKVAITIQAYDITKTKPVISQMYSAEVSGKNSKENTLNELNKLPFSFSDSTFSSSIIGKALDQTLRKAQKAVHTQLQR